MLLFVKTILYSWYTKILVGMSRLLRLGSGTSIGGLVSEKILPEISTYFNGKYTKIIFISGTNGKTTTRSIINFLLAQQGLQVCSNRGGANIFRGIITALMLDLSFWGSVKSEYLVLEVEEATLPRLCTYLKPDILVLTNIFRDQLDAYGEIDKTLDFFTRSILLVDPVVIANKDDQKLIQHLQPTLKTEKFYGFSVESNEKIRFEPPESHSKSHLVDFADSLVIKMRKDDSLDIEVSKDTPRLFTTYTQIHGVYNIYNIAAAAQTLSLIVDTYDYLQSIKNYQPAFGRGEQISYCNTTISLYLVKNPAGYDSVLNYVAKHYRQESTQIIFALNDNIADGRDVSWIWDVNFENFFNRYTPLECDVTGTRLYDMLLRLSYAGAPVKTIGVTEKLKSISDIISKNQGTNNPRNIVILATYTALLDIRKALALVIPELTSKIHDEGN